MLQKVRTRKDFLSSAVVSFQFLSLHVGIIHLVRTHKRTGGQAKAFVMRTRGRGLDMSKYVYKDVLFGTYFVIFSYAGNF